MDQNIIGMTALVGLVNGIKLFQSDRVGFYHFLIAVLVGVAMGFFGFLGFTVESGFVSGLAAAGLYKLSEKLGGN